MQNYILCYLRSVSGKKIRVRCFCGSKRFHTEKKFIEMSNYLAHLKFLIPILAVELIERRYQDLNQ